MRRLIDTGQMSSRKQIESLLQSKAVLVYRKRVGDKHVSGDTIMHLGQCMTGIPCYTNKEGSRVWCVTDVLTNTNEYVTIAEIELLTPSLFSRH